MSVAQPIKTHIIDQSLNKSIVITYYLLLPVNHHQLTDLFSFHNHSRRPCLANQEPNTNCVTSFQNLRHVEIANLPAKNYTLLNVHTSATFYTDDKLEILRLYVYSLSLRAGKVLSKSELWPKIWLEGLLLIPKQVVAGGGNSCRFMVTHVCVYLFLAVEE